jgi:hypothetical protein
MEQCVGLEVSQYGRGSPWRERGRRGIVKTPTNETGKEGVRTSFQMWSRGFTEAYVEYMCGMVIYALRIEG